MVLIEGIRYVAFFDILGFKNWIESEGSRNVFEYIRRFLNLMIRSSLPNSKVNSDMSVNVGESNIFYINFSDSIVFYTKDDTYDSFSTIIKVCAQFINIVICGPSRSIRGAISVGEFYADPESNAFVGQALIDAYHLEEQQDWLGVCLHNDIIDTPNFLKAKNEFPRLFVQSQKQTKSSSYKPFCINWIDEDVICASFDALRSLDAILISGLKSLCNEPERAEKFKQRIMNTKNFIKFCEGLQ